jgi:ABC-2 type transport system ATP-binding protein
MHAIEVDGLRKAYGDLVVVDDLSFHVAPGELLAILGHNGAGKTTTVEILEGHRRRDRGRVAVLGMDPETGGRALRRRIGIVLQEAGIGDTVTVAESPSGCPAASRPRISPRRAASRCGTPWSRCGPRPRPGRSGS